jgi:hypothetical protein
VHFMTDDLAAVEVEDEEQVEPAPLHLGGQEGQILSAKSESCQWSQRYVRSGRWRAHSSGSARYCLHQFAEGSLQLSLPPNAGAFLDL